MDGIGWWGVAGLGQGTSRILLPDRHKQPSACDYPALGADNDFDGGSLALQYRLSEKLSCSTWRPDCNIRGRGVSFQPISGGPVG